MENLLGPPVRWAKANFGGCGVKNVSCSNGLTPSIVADSMLYIYIYIYIYISNSKYPKYLIC